MEHLSLQNVVCSCSDPGCPAHLGRSACMARATGLVDRIDMCAGEPVPFCAACTRDALDSGMFIALSRMESLPYLYPRW